MKKIAEGARAVKKLGGQIDAATSGDAGLAFEASKELPVVGAVTGGSASGAHSR